MGYGRFIITAQFLIDAFHLPPETEVLGVAPNYHGGYCDIELTVAHPDLTSMESERAPLVRPTFHKQEPIVFEGWGQA